MRREGVVLVLLAMMALVSCGVGEDASRVAADAPVAEAAPKVTAPPVAASVPRFDQLLKAWSAAGLKAEMVAALRSNSINSTYGSSRHYQVNLNDRMAVVLEFDLDKLNSTGTNFIKFVEENGYVRRTNEPAWRSAEFVLLDTASRIENGEVTQKFSLKDHPDRDRILEVFRSFQ